MRSVNLWSGKTDDSAIPKAVKLRVWERCGGKCAITGRKLQVGDEYDFDHIIPLAIGGKHEEANLQVVSREAHREKTKDDVKAISKARRVRMKHLGLWERKGPKIKSRGFAKRTIAVWASATLFIAGGLAGAYVSGRAAARPAMYTEKPPAAYRGAFSARLTVLSTPEAVANTCRWAGFPVPPGGYLAACYIKATDTIIAPSPCLGGGWYADLLCHEGGHTLGWSEDHTQ